LITATEPPNASCIGGSDHLFHLHRPLELAAADQVVMKVEYRLLAMRAGVGDHTEPGLVDAQFLGHFLQDEMQMADQILLFFFDVKHGEYMLFRDDQHMYRGDRVDVVKRQRVLILVHLLGRQFTFHDFAENAIHFHHLSFFSSYHRLSRMDRKGMTSKK